MNESKSPACFVLSKIPTHLPGVDSLTAVGPLANSPVAPAPCKLVLELVGFEGKSKYISLGNEIMYLWVRE